MADRSRRNAFLNDATPEPPNSADCAPTPIEQMINGRNLEYWLRDKVFKEPATASANAVGQIAKDICAGARLRSLEIRSKNGQISIIDPESPAIQRKLHSGGRANC